VCSSVSADCAASPRGLINVSLCRLAAVYPLYPAGGRAATADPPVPAQAGAHAGPVQYHPRLTPAQAPPPVRLIFLQKIKDMNEKQLNFSFYR
jgi:hypothetical protein